MNYLHSLQQKIIHRDLKSHNVLVTKGFQVKVADFGLTYVGEKQSQADSEAGNFGVIGTPEWMAPEVMEGQAYSEKVDVYSFGLFLSCLQGNPFFSLLLDSTVGILLTEMVSRQMPFRDLYALLIFFNEYVRYVGRFFSVVMTFNLTWMYSKPFWMMELFRQSLSGAMAR